MKSPVVTAASFFWELIKVFLIAVIIIIPIRYFLVQPFFVRGASMEPSFHNGEYLVIDQLSYRFREPQRGEVIVFRFPENPSQFFIKRIVGLPGDEITVRDGVVFLRNEDFLQEVQLDESGYLSAGTRTGGSLTTQLTDGQYFVLGDNRVASSDSRSWGALSRNHIVGRVWVRAWPLTEMTTFTPQSPGFVAP